MTIRSFYWILLAVVVIFLWQLPNVKKLSPYNKKWLIVYTLYAVIVSISIPEDLGFCKSAGDVTDILTFFVLLPAITYVLLSVTLKYIGKWKIIKWIDKAIDRCYQNIKNLA